MLLFWAIKSTHPCCGSSAICEGLQTPERQAFTAARISWARGGECFSSHLPSLPSPGLLLLRGRGEGMVGPNVGRTLPCSHLPSMENIKEGQGEGHPRSRTCWSQASFLPGRSQRPPAKGAGAQPQSACGRDPKHHALPPAPRVSYLEASAPGLPAPRNLSWGCDIHSRVPAPDPSPATTKVLSCSRAPRSPRPTSATDLGRNGECRSQFPKWPPRLP